MAKLPSKSKDQQRKARTRFSDEYGVLLELLIELRLKAGISQVDMANAVGKSQQMVSAWERRESEISAIDIWKWCKKTGIKVSKFYEQFEKRIERL